MVIGYFIHLRKYVPVQSNSAIKPTTKQILVQVLQRERSFCQEAVVESDNSNWKENMYQLYNQIYTLLLLMAIS